MRLIFPRKECIAHLGKSDDASLESYRRLQRLSSGLRPLQEAAEGAAPHLIDYVSGQIHELRLVIQKSFSEQMEQTLKKMNWPKAATAVPLALEQEWSTNVGKLLDLQMPDLEDRERNANRDHDSEPAPLLPFEVLVTPLEQRFTYHFSGNKPTNRLDKPEYFLNHVAELISQYSEFVQETMQPLLLHHFRGSDLAFTPAYLDAITAFITALLPMLKRRLYGFASQLSNQPSLLSHLVQEVISFDTMLSESYSYTPSSPSVAWRGLSFFLLDTCEYFQPWLSVERDFALTRYHAIVESPEAGTLDYDSVNSDATKPTKAAIRVNDLLETITERYRHLSSFSQKLRFLIDIQIEIFDQYFKRLRSGLDAYLTRTSTIGRTVTSISKEEQAELHGAKGLDRLCRVFGSAEYLERAMRDWSDDVFFIELWGELNFRAKHHDRVGRNVGSWQEIQQKTSSALGSTDNNENTGVLEGALFDETAGNYHQLRVRSENILIETLTHNIRQTLKSYGSITTWSTLSTSRDTDTTVSAELQPTLSILDETFSFLRRAVSKATLRRITRQACHTVQTYVWDHILTSRATFSTAGAAQLTVDIRAVCAQIDRHAGPGQAQTCMSRLLEGVTLLSLPIRGDSATAQRPSSQDSDAAAWDDMSDVAGDTSATNTRAMGLFQAERLIFMDNESARHALEQLGLLTLSEADARAILGRRLELGS